ncbi:MAG: DUF418 domain-containing protein [Bacteroidales bacterium]
METALPVEPLKNQKRVFILDVLRGFALLGILMVNMPLFNSPIGALIGDWSLWTDPVNMAGRWVIDFFFHGKFYVLFSLLFGIGFYYFMRKADEAGAGVIGVFRRRLFILLLIGALHVLLLWYGDILVIYALFGFIMTWFRNKSNRFVITWAIVFLLIPVAFTAMLYGAVNMAMDLPEIRPELEASFRESELQFVALTDRAMQAYSSGSFSEIIRIRLTEYSYMLGGVFSFFPTVLSMFLLGLFAGRKGYLENTAKHWPFFKKLLWISLPFAITGNWLVATYSPMASHVMPDIELLITQIGFSTGGPATVFVYISLFVYWLHCGCGRWLAQKFAMAGRMALTNYLTQSIICTTIFYSYGLGLYGKVDYVYGILLTMVIFVVQLAWSNYWLRHFRFGPFEWVWRSLTYGKLQPMKKK